MFKTKNKLNIVVRGMSCSHCVNSVEKALLNLDGVKRVKVDLKSGKVVIEYVGVINKKDVNDCIQELGYKVEDVL